MTTEVARRTPLDALDIRRPGKLLITHERSHEVHTIRLFGELDLASTAELETKLARAEAKGPEEIILDLSGLTFIDSTGIALVLAAESRSSADSHRLTLRRGPAAVQRVFEICAIEDLLPFAD